MCYNSSLLFEVYVVLTLVNFLLFGSSAVVLVTYLIEQPLLIKEIIQSKCFNTAIVIAVGKKAG